MNSIVLHALVFERGAVQPSTAQISGTNGMVTAAPGRLAAFLPGDCGRTSGLRCQIESLWGASCDARPQPARNRHRMNRLLKTSVTPFCPWEPLRSQPVNIG